MGRVNKSDAGVESSAELTPRRQCDLALPGHLGRVTAPCAVLTRALCLHFGGTEIGSTPLAARDPRSDRGRPSRALPFVFVAMAISGNLIRGALMRCWYGTRPVPALRWSVPGRGSGTRGGALDGRLSVHRAAPLRLAPRPGLSLNCRDQPSTRTHVRSGCSSDMPSARIPRFLVSHTDGSDSPGKVRRSSANSHIRRVEVFMALRWHLSKSNSFE